MHPPFVSHRRDANAGRRCATTRVQRRCTTTTPAIDACPSLVSPLISPFRHPTERTRGRLDATDGHWSPPPPFPPIFFRLALHLEPIRRAAGDLKASQCR